MTHDFGKAVRIVRLVDGSRWYMRFCRTCGEYVVVSRVGEPVGV